MYKGPQKKYRGQGPQDAAKYRGILTPSQTPPVGPLTPKFF